MNRRASRRNRIALVAVALTGALLLPASSGAIDFEHATLMYFATWGPPEDLLYEFTSYHFTHYTNYTGVQSVYPVAHDGWIEKRGWLGLWGAIEGCWSVGLVNNTPFECWNYALSSCPVAEGTYRARSRTVSANLQVIAGVSWTTIANCLNDPPGPCNAGVMSGASTVIDLDSGLVLDPAVAKALPPTHLDRLEEHRGKSFVMEEWTLVGGDREPGTGVRSSSLAASERRGEVTADLTNALLERALPVGSSYLVIQAPAHPRPMPPPLVKFRHEEVEAAVAPQDRGGRLLVRATFSEGGALERVETLLGDPRLGGLLGEGLGVEYPHGHGHRTVVYATFDLEERLDPVAAVPVRPRCCCGTMLCA